MGLAKKMIRITAVLLVVFLLIPLVTPVDASAYSPPRTTLRIGLNFNTTALASSNLQNEVGSGFEFGYYDANLNFTRVATTTETRLSVIIDHNMQWNASGSFSGEYVSKGTGATTAGIPAVGYLHWQINSGRTNLNDALNDIKATGATDGFVRYLTNGTFVPMYGSYTTTSARDAARRSASHTSNGGTGYTITVAATGTGRVLFEFDNGSNTARLLGIRPIGSGKLSTHYRGYRYYGGFRYQRLVNQALTVVNIVNIEDYVQGVIPYEMSNSWPLEALKAQALCARTYVISQLNKHNSYGIDVCTEMDCQVYRGRNSANATTDRAVNETAGMYITYNGALCETFYVSSHGGGSENNENIWTGTPRPYLRGVIDTYEEDPFRAGLISNYNWTSTISQASLTQRVKSAGYPNASTIVSIWVSQYTPTGNVLSVTMSDSNGRQYTFSRRAGLQAAFGASLIRTQRFNIGSVAWQQGGTIYANVPAQAIPSTSQRYVISSENGVASTTAVSGTMSAIDGAGTIKNVVGGGQGTTMGSPTGPVNGNFTLTGRGWGHSVGMSQWGAYSQARYYNRTAQQIVQHYFTGVQISKAT